MRGARLSGWNVEGEQAGRVPQQRPARLCGNYKIIAETSQVALHLVREELRGLLEGRDRLPIWPTITFFCAGSKKCAAGTRNAPVCVRIYCVRFSVKCV